MALVDIRIPQLGEGLQEARIVRFMKRPGEAVARDEPIFEMETDKALMEIESPSEGVLDSWEASEDEVLPIGAIIGRISVAGNAESAPAATPDAHPAPRQAPSVHAQSPPAEPAALRNAQIPPKTRSYAREQGLSDDDMARLAAQTGKKLLPEDVDRFLATIGAGSDKLAFDEVDVPANQRTLVFRLQRGAQGVIPATLEMAAEWSRIESVAAALRRDQGEAAPSKFVLFAWCVAQAAKGHAAFRSSVPSDSALRRYKHLHLGIAVARAEDELLIARVEAVDALAFPEFVASAREAIERARAGEDQAADPMQIILTNLARTGARFGTPVLAAPSVATIYAGAPYDEAYPLQGGGVGFRRIAHLVMTFDHRAANGMGAAAFLGEVRQRCEDFELQGVSST